MSKNKPVKVTHIASGDLWAGAEVQLFTLAKILHLKPDVSINIILMNHGELEQRLLKQGINVTVLDESQLNGLQILRRLIGIFKETQPDIIHSHRQKENILSSIATLFCGHPPSCRTQHGASEHKPAWHNAPQRLIIFLDWFCGRYLQNQIIAVSTDLGNKLQAEFPAKKISVIVNGIDFTALPAIQNNMHTENKTIKTGIIGRLVSVKRIDLFIKAADIICKKQANENVSFHIYGEGPLLQDLKQQAENLHVNNILHFEGHCNDIHQQLQTLDILLMTSDHEGLPMTLLEAMALGTPIIAHAVGGIPDLLDNGRCGILINDHKPQAYANATLKLITDEQKRKELASLAQRRVKQHYSATSNAENYLQMYQRLLP